MNQTNILNQNEIVALTDGVTSAVRRNTPDSDHKYQDIRIHGLDKTLPASFEVIFKASAISVSMLDRLESMIVHGARRDLGIQLTTNIVGVNAYTTRKVKVVLSFYMNRYVQL